MDSTSKIFTVAKANDMLPLVGSIARDLMDLHAQVEVRQSCLEAAAPYESPHHDLYAEEVGEIRDSLAADRNRIASYIAELESLGLEVHSARQGCVDFPAYREGERVALCWKASDGDVSHWHHWGDLAARHEIVAAEAFDGTVVSKTESTPHSAIN